MAGNSKQDRLDSWKAIAVYLGRSVRTVRRWEAAEGLPVHRQMHRAQGSVYAYRSELEAWRQRRDVAGAPTVPVERAEQPSIAVLPFTYVGPDADSSYLADGFTDEVIADLSKIRTLRVISRTSSMTLKGSTRDARTLGRELAVRYLLEGSVRHERTRLRISVRLIDAPDDNRMWAEKYDGALDDVFTIQERISRDVVEALALRLTAGEERSLAHHPIDDLLAWQCMLRARQEALRWRGDAIGRAIELLEKALAAAGGSVELYAALGRTHLQYREAGVDFGEAPVVRAEEYAAKVFELDPAAAAGLALSGWIHYSRGRIGDAVRDLEAALTDDWSNPDVLGLLCNCYLISGQVASARPYIGRLLAIDPLTPLNRCLPGWADVLEGKREAAIEPYREMLEMDPGNPMARLFYVWVLALNGRSDEVAATAAGFPPELSESVPARIARLLASAVSGRSASLDRAFFDELEVASDLFPRFLAHAYALAEDPERAVRWLSVAVERGFVNYPFLAHHDPICAGLAKYPPYLELLGEVRERWQAFGAAGRLRPQPTG